MLNKTKIFSIISLSIIWVCLNGIRNDSFYILISIGSLFFTYLISSYLNLFEYQIRISIRSIKYFLYLFKELCISSINIIKMIWGSKNNIISKFEWIETNLEDKSFALIIYANSITITPGTITADIKDNMILIHAISDSLIEDLKNENMIKNINTNI